MERRETEGMRGDRPGVRIAPKVIAEGIEEREKDSLP
jgi:hypothetical protein